MIKIQKSTLHIIITTVAIGMIVTSGILQYFIIIPSDHKISEYRQAIVDNQTLIRDLWNSFSINENKVNAALTISALTTKDNSEAQKVRDYYLLAFSSLSRNAQIQDIIKAMDKERNDTIDYINRIYAKQSDIQEEIAVLDMSKKRLADVAFFLQMISLMLVIIKKDIPNE
jgi:hypothetical protein